MRKHNYLIGFITEGHGVYGGYSDYGISRYVNLLTIDEAQNMINKWKGAQYKKHATIFKLVKIKTKNK